MKVTSFRLWNWMAFSDTDWLDLSPVTLVFGMNSSGKSALIRALLTLKQSIGLPRIDSDPLRFSTKDGLADLGGFRSALHRQAGDTSRDQTTTSMVFGFRVDCTGDAILDTTRELIRRTQVIQQSEESLLSYSELELRFGWDAIDDQIRPSVLELRALPRADTHPTYPSILLASCIRMDSEKPNAPYAVFGDVPIDVAENIRLDYRSQTGFWTGMFVHPDGDALKLEDILHSLQIGVEDFLDTITYVGPLRPVPERVYVVRRMDSVDDHLMRRHGWRDFLEGQLDSKDFDFIEEWITRLGIGTGIEVVCDRDVLPIKRSIVMIKDGNLKTNLRDAGFGASQALPIIVAARLALPNSLVIVEQPELHLHPAAQANIGSLFAECALASTGRRDTPRFWIESHSETLQLRLRCETIRAQLPKDPDEEDSSDEAQQNASQMAPAHSDPIRALFVSRKDIGSTCGIVRYDEFGAYSEVPDGFANFFGSDIAELQGLREMRSRLMAARKQTSKD